MIPIFFEDADYTDTEYCGELALSNLLMDLASDVHTDFYNDFGDLYDDGDDDILNLTFDTNS